MLERVVLILDGVAEAIAASATALDISARAGAPLEIVGVVDASRLDRDGPGGVGSSELAAETQSTLAARLSARLEDALERCAELAAAHGVRVEARIERTSATEVLRSAVQRSVVFVVPNTLRDRRDEDSVDVEIALDPARIVRDFPGPLLLVAHEPLGSGPAMLAADGEASSARAVEAALELGFLDGREIVVASVADSERAAAGLGEGIVAQLEARGRAVRFEAIVSDDAPHAALLGWCAAAQPALVVMGTSPQRGLSAWFAGNNTPDLLRGLNPPILTCA